MPEVFNFGGLARFKKAARILNDKRRTNLVRSVNDAWSQISFLGEQDVPDSVRPIYREVLERMQSSKRLTPDEAEGVKYRILGVFAALQDAAPDYSRGSKRK